jgi:hypothetical protein
MITFLLTYLPTRNNLNRLLERWTTAVAAIATGKGKNTANTGVSIVPRPNPENKVKPDAIIATRHTTRYSISFPEPVIP